MAGEIQQAAQRLNERKLALFNIDEPKAEAMDAEIGQIMALLGGFDLDPEEVMGFGRSAQMMLITMLMQGEHPVQLGQAMWVDGLAMGLLLAEARATESSGGGYPSEGP